MIWTSPKPEGRRGNVSSVINLVIVTKMVPLSAQGVVKLIEEEEGEAEVQEEEEEETS
jgi:hypothetical protein